MKTMVRLALFLIMSFVCIILSAQDYSTINLLYKGKLGRLDEFITLNNIQVATLSLGSRLQCKIYSEGTVNVKSNNAYNGQDFLSLKVQHGKTFYIEMVAKGGASILTGKLELVDEKEGKEAFEKNEKYELTLFEEDLNDPIIKLNNPNQFTQNNVIVKTDTVRQIVYVDPNQDKKYSFKQTSDVDINIPDNKLTNDLRFAFIIGNEDYSSNQGDLSSEINVDFARNDASAFKEYAIKTLGIPANNVIFLLDATTGQMKQGISKLNLIIKNTQGKADVFVYYAGHGLPDEQTKEAYLIPVDVSGKNAADGIKLKDLYTRLTEFPSKRVTLFIDACFSGGARNQGLLAARGVKVKPKEDLLNGDIVVFTASSGEQSSLPYKEKQHGFFTYFLLKKMQVSKGDITYGELSRYINDNVTLQSVLINDKEQSPQVNVSLSIENEWAGFLLK